MITLTIIILLIILFLLGLGALTILSPLLLDVAIIIGIVSLIKWIISTGKKKKGEEKDE